MNLSLKLRHLEVFNALFEAGSVSRAATRLNLTQPAVSIALSTFEDALGFRLFHRKRGYFAPTTEATLLHDEVVKTLHALSQVQNRAVGILSGQTGGVSIATNGVLAVNFLPELVAGFQQDHPSLQVEIRVHSSRQIASWVANHQIDIGVIDPPVPVAGLDAQIFEFECVCVLRQDDPLASRDLITLEDLAGRSVIKITGDHETDRQFDALLANSNVAVSRKTSVYYFAIARNIVAAGRDIAILDPINGKVALGDDVVWRPFAPRIKSSVAIITATGQPIGQAVREMQVRLCTSLQALAI